MIDDAIIYKKLRAAVSLSAGFPLRGAADALEVGETAVVQMRNIDADSGVDWNSTAKVALPSKRKPDWLEAGDVIFAARGAKNYAVALDHVPKQAVCSPHFFVLRIRQDDCDPHFLAWQINQKPAQDYFRRTATGSHVLNIRRDALEHLKIALPPLAQQRIIVEYFKTASKERQALNKLIENSNTEMEALARSLFQNNLKG